MLTFHINLTEIGIFLAVLLRLGFILFMLPVFNSQQFPARVKVCCTVALAAMIFPLVRESVPPLEFQPGPVCAVILSELLFAMLLALTFLLLFAGLQVGGELMSFQMGFTFAQVADPTYGGQMPTISRWLQGVATMILISLNGHHIFIRTIVESFRSVPLGGFALHASDLGKIVHLSGLVFVIGIKIAAPVMIVLLLAHIAMGLLSKFAPQLNIMATSPPITILLGFFILGISFLVWGEAIQNLLFNAFLIFKSFTNRPAP